MIFCNPFWFGFGWWWIFPIIMLALCFFMMRGCMGRMMGRFSSGNSAENRSVAPHNAAQRVEERQH
jgi:hypothetical protein